MKIMNGFSIFEYVHSPGMSLQKFPHYIREREKEKHNRDITTNQAKHRSRQIIAISKKAMEAAEWDKVIVIADKEAGTIRGRLTKKKGTPQRGGRKDRYGYLPYRSDKEWIQTFMENEDCDESKAKEIFTSGKKNGWLSLHCGLWGGCFAEKVGTNRRPLTENQKQNWELYATMPPVRHNLILSESDHLRWLIQFWKERSREMSPEGAELERLRVWNSAKDESRIPWKKENGFVVGKSYAITRAFRTMPQMREDNPAFDAFLDKVDSDTETAVASWLDAIKCGDLIKLSENEDGLLTCVGADVLRSPDNEDSGYSEGWTPETWAMMKEEEAREAAKQAAAGSMDTASEEYSDESEDSEESEYCDEESVDNESHYESDDEPEQRDGESGDQYTARRLGITATEVVRRRKEDERRATEPKVDARSHFESMRALLG